MQVGSKQVLVNSCYAEDDTERHCSEISTVLVSKGIKSSVTEIVSLEQLFLKWERQTNGVTQIQHFVSIFRTWDLGEVPTKM